MPLLLVVVRGGGRGARGHGAVGGGVPRGVAGGLQQEHRHAARVAGRSGDEPEAASPQGQQRQRQRGRGERQSDRGGGDQADRGEERGPAAAAGERQPSGPRVGPAQQPQPEGDQGGPPHERGRRRRGGAAEAQGGAPEGAGAAGTHQRGDLRAHPRGARQLAPRVAAPAAGPRKAEARRRPPTRKGQDRPGPRRRPPAARQGAPVCLGRPSTPPGLYPHVLACWRAGVLVLLFSPPLTVRAHGSRCSSSSSSRSRIWWGGSA